MSKLKKAFPKYTLESWWPISILPNPSNILLSSEGQWYAYRITTPQNYYNLSYHCGTEASLKKIISYTLGNLNRGKFSIQNLSRKISLKSSLPEWKQAKQAGEDYLEKVI